ncbi:bifunctional sugar phosphate isomerase/epimerase/4-hydroxyphenylpyruvate dioxygenase family protein [Streptomyces sp. NBC_00102]|uniref:bifunctional sugar phosphate isomerase/epimerase/4-hydroxyphenylpyruvate dioxygenase family protein n=1 Tax=Streptomyces sp. NBC_00102 TaxID=2975652 RepID=UPI002251D094|nr:sugar phosphate isomerase/epimerase and 4-hydroxyphenylpyruvate domain-containing protein [Streptomyces sp. NBC_00102]MCX5395512.1 sugar phosphate isomerase/epimerase and 4-hydroxyphenylpyruvate domain-containing protein [Streptomyces sp. NBC_00102]
MRTSIATVSLSGSLTEKLDAIARAGFDGVEIFENDLLGCPLSPEQVRERAEQLGLSIDLYQPFRDFDSTSPERLRANLRRAEHKFRLMNRLGTDTLLVCSNASPDAVTDDDLAAEQLRQLAERAADHGIRIAYEALAWGRHVDTYLHAWRIVRAADHPNLGTCLDSFHILSRGSEPEGIEAIPGDKIFFLQLADAPLLAMDVLRWSRHYRCFPGQGGFDLAGLLANVLRTGYTGPLSLEVFNDNFRQADTGRTAVDAKRSLTVLEESVADILSTGSPLPRPGQPGGFAFAEIATPDPERLGSLLSALGFAHTGRHGTKPVELWEQRGARILLNRAVPEAAGNGSTSLVALGLDTPDPELSAARARALLSPVLPRDRAPDEASLDAVAAPDGTALFFCDSTEPRWREDFSPTVPRGGTPGSVRSIDHVVLAHPWDQFDEAALFYRAVLGLDPHESIEVADPYGLLRSRAMTNRAGTLRLVLNMAKVGPRGLPGQHIALADDDIRATARRLRDLPYTETLPIPDNYYDDLRARFDLGEERHQELRELGLLYDRDEHGEFLHLYTVTVDRVFFELVQRIDGYQGFGTANAPARLTAQHAPAPAPAE